MKQPNRNTPTEAKVTIICVTYNQEKYIEQCLKSLVTQKHNVKYQIFIGEDCSTDNTRKIVQEYEIKYPEIIIAFYREKNMGSVENFLDLCERVNTPYFTFCDGDDFWTDELRLQKQYDFLENNPKIKGCFCRSSILVEDNWGLKEHFDKDNKKLVWPDCQHGFNPKKRLHNAKDMALLLPAQSSNTMMRRNVKLYPLPFWMHKTYVCDAPLIILHLGKGELAFMPDNMSAYRRSSSGLFFSKTQEEHMLKTRPQYIIYFWGLRNFFSKYYDKFAVTDFENRIKLEVANYFRVLMKKNNYNEIANFIRSNPEIAKISLNAYLSFYNDQRYLTKIHTWEGYKIIARSKNYQIFTAGLVKFWVALKKMPNNIKQKNIVFRKKARAALKAILSRFFYNWNAYIKKDKKLWVFTSFRQKGYMDNSKYFFEYVSKNNPEIRAVWLTRDHQVYDELTAQGYSCCMSRSIKGFRIMRKAAIAVTDHFRVTDYPASLGFNSKTKVVQLWHGVGFKSMGNGHEVKNTDVPGVVYSYDIIASPTDSKSELRKKKRARKKIGYTRELFEEYFLLVCPGQERIDMIGNVWNVEPENMFLAGHPRNYPVYQALARRDAKRTDYNVIYAPTYRKDSNMEKAFIQRFLEEVPKLNNLMTKIGGIFSLRLHVHTWRNYDKLINDRIMGFNRIRVDKTKDIYESLSNYDLMISDYSSISLDFAFFRKPVIYLIEDYKEFCKKDSGFNLDFLKMTPGPKTYSWKGVYNLIRKFYKEPDYNLDARKRILKYFFLEEANSINNSANIANEIKRRLGLA